MSKRRQGEMPATGAGLIRYFKEEGNGIKISPKLIIGAAIALMIFELLLRFWGNSLLGF